MVNIVLNLTPAVVGAEALAFHIVDVALVVLRLHARRAAGIELGTDDWLELAALMSYSIAITLRLTHCRFLVNAHCPWSRPSSRYD